MSRKPILQIIVVDKSQSLCIFAQRRIPPAGKAAAVGRKVADFCPKTVQFFAIVVEFSLAGGHPTLVSRRAAAHLRDTPSRTAPPLQIPLKKRQNVPSVAAEQSLYIATRRSRKASCHSPGAPAPLWTQGNSAPNAIGTTFRAVCSMVSRSQHTAARSQRHRSAQPVRLVGTDRPPPHTATAACPRNLSSRPQRHGRRSTEVAPVAPPSHSPPPMNSLLARLRRYFVRRQDDRRNERAEDFLKALLVRHRRPDVGSARPRGACRHHGRRRRPHPRGSSRRPGTDARPPHL